MRVTAGELNFALIASTSMSTADIDLLRSAQNYELVPAFVGGVVPIFNLPDAIKKLAKDATKVKELGLPTLLPLTLDLEVMTGIYICSITNWLDPRLLALNPQLSPWFAVTNSSTNLTLIAGATSTTDPNTASRLLFKMMESSDMAQLDEYAFALRAKPTMTTSSTTTATGVIASDYNSYFTSYPFAAIRNRYPTSPNMVLIEYEARLSLKTLSTPGSVSYRILGTGTGTGEFDPSTEFQFKIKNSNGVNEIIQPNTASLRRCSQIHTLFTSDQITSSAMATSLMTNDEMLNGFDSEVIKEKITNLYDWEVQRTWINQQRPAPGQSDILTHSETHTHTHTYTLKDTHAYCIAYRHRISTST